MRALFVALSLFLAPAAAVAQAPFRGAVPVATELMAGRIDLLFTSYISIGEQAKAGKLRMIAVAGKKRTDAAPELPTVAEAGFAGLDMDMVAPAGRRRRS